MQLNELLEKHTLKEISKRTNISEENLDVLFNKEFDALTKVKALGFISIIEREFKAELSALRKEAKDYFEKHGDEVGVVLDVPVTERKSGVGKIFLWLLLMLVLVAGGWYVSMQYNKTKLPDIFSFTEILKSPENHADTNVSETSEATSNSNALEIEDDTITME
jgi:predicted secreted protein